MLLDQEVLALQHQELAACQQASQQVPQQVPQHQPPKSKKGVPKALPFSRFSDPIVNALGKADSETSPPQQGGSRGQGVGPALTSAGLNDNNESLNQTRGSSNNFSPVFGGTDHAGKKLTHPADLLFLQSVESRKFIDDVMGRVFAERFQYQEEIAARKRASRN